LKQVFIMHYGQKASISRENKRIKI